MLDKRAYAEVFYIINEMSEELRNKIPTQTIKNIENKMDRNYEFIVDDIEEAELLPDTEKILSVLYTDYLATEEERIIIKNKEKIIKEKKKINLPDIEINEIFSENIKKENKALVETTSNKWYMDILNFLKKIFKK